MNDCAAYYDKIPAHLKRVNGFSEEYSDLPPHQRAFIESLVGAPSEWVITLPDGREIRHYAQLQFDPSSKGL